MEIKMKKTVCKFVRFKYIIYYLAVFECMNVKRRCFDLSMKHIANMFVRITACSPKKIKKRYN